jgi:hypothetical protein
MAQAEEGAGECGRPGASARVEYERPQTRVGHPSLQARGVYAPGGTSHRPTGAPPSG